VTEVTWSILRTARHRDASGDNLPLGSRPSRQPLLSGSTPSDGLPAHGNYNLRLGAEVWLVGGVRSPEYPRPAPPSPSPMLPAHQPRAVAAALTNSSGRSEFHSTIRDLIPRCEISRCFCRFIVALSGCA